MLFEPVDSWSGVMWLARLSGEGEVVQVGDAEHGVVDAVAFEAVVAQDLPALHAGEGVLDAGADLFVRSVVFLFPGWEFGLSGCSPVGDRQSGVLIAAVGDCRGGADGGFDAGLPQPRESWRLPGSGRPTTTTRRV